ncbi:MAG: tail fiber domain-containing protein [Deltaproteobacteria bacterium]|nr:tail fiber domain-containing protein [Deltaproteobacteria bacterium]
MRPFVVNPAGATPTVDDAIAAAEVNGGIVVLPHVSVSAFTEYAVSRSNLPVNVTLQVHPGARLVPSSVFTIEGYIDAEPQQIFASEAVTRPGDHLRQRTVYAEWWGAVADDDVDDGPAIQKAIDFITGSDSASAKLELLPGAYRVGQTLMIRRGCEIDGTGHGRAKSATTKGTGTLLLATSDRSLVHVQAQGLLASENQNFVLGHVRLDISPEIHATSSSYGIDLGDSNAIMTQLDDVDIGAFYHAVYSTGARVWATNMQINNTRSHGVDVSGADEVLFRDVRVIASNGDGFHSTVLYARLLDCETFGNAGWGVYAKDVEIVGGYFNNDWAGEIFLEHTESYGRGGTILGPVIEFAGDIPSGWHGLSTNPTAPGIKMKLSGSGSATLSNAWIGSSQGSGVVIESGLVTMGATTVQFSGRSGTPGAQYDIQQTGGRAIIGSSNIFAGHGVYASGGYLVLASSRVTTNGRHAVRLEGQVSANITGNDIFSNYSGTDRQGISVDSTAVPTVTYGNNTFTGYLTSSTGVSESDIRTSPNKLKGDVRVEGNLGIGKNADPSRPIDLANGAYVTASGVWVSASTRAAKTDILPLDQKSALDTLRNLQPVSFRYKKDLTEVSLGFIAEDVPEIVAMNNHASLNAMEIVAVLTAVVKEQDQRIEALERTQDELKQALLRQ